MGPHMLVRRDLICAHGRPFDESLVLADNDMCLRVLQGASFAFDPEPLGFTREHKGAVSRDVMAVRKMHFLEWLINLDRYGPRIYPAERFRQIRRTYLRHYIRRMLTWPTNVRSRHYAALRRYGVRIGKPEQIDMLANWVGKRLRLQEAWIGYPF